MHRIAPQTNRTQERYQAHSRAACDARGYCVSRAVTRKRCAQSNNEAHVSQDLREAVSRALR